MIIINNGTLLKAKNHSSKSKIFYFFRAHVTLTAHSKVKSGFLGRMCRSRRRNGKRSELQEAGVANSRRKMFPGVNSVVPDLNLTKQEQKRDSRPCAKGPQQLREDTHRSEAANSFQGQALDLTVRKWPVRGSKAQAQRLAPELCGQVEQVQIITPWKAAGECVLRTRAQLGYSNTCCAQIHNRMTPATASQVQRTAPNRNLRF